MVKTITLSREEASKLYLNCLYNLPLQLEWDHASFKIILKSAGDFPLARLRVPLDQFMNTTILSVHQRASKGFRETPYFIGLMRSGEAIFDLVDPSVELNPNPFQKRLRFYTVRKEHGKAQTKHQSTKGKSRGGGPIRMKQYQRFIEETASHLCSFFASRYHDQANLLLACPPNIWGDLKPLLGGNYRKRISLPGHYEKPDEASLKKCHKLIGKAELEVLHSDAVSDMLLTSLVKVDKRKGSS